LNAIKLDLIYGTTSFISLSREKGSANMIYQEMVDICAKREELIFQGKFKVEKEELLKTRDFFKEEHYRILQRKAK